MGQRACKYCGSSIEAGADFCGKCGQHHGASQVNSSYEVGRIAAIQDVREIVYKQLKVFVAIATGVAALGAVSLYEVTKTVVTENIRSDIREYISESKRMIENESVSARESVRYLERDNLKLLAQLAQDRSSAKSEFDNIKENQIRLLNEIKDIAQRASSAQLELDKMVSEVNATLTLRDVVAGFFLIRSLEVRTRLFFNKDDAAGVKSLAEKHYFQVNFRNDKGEVMQFLPNGDRPIFIGGESVTHSHVLYYPYVPLIGKNMNVLGDIRRMDVRFFTDSQYNALTWSMLTPFIGVTVDLYINGAKVLSKSGDIKIVLPSDAGDGSQVFSTDVSEHFFDVSQLFISAVRAQSDPGFKASASKGIESP